MRITRHNGAFSRAVDTVVAIATAASVVVPAFPVTVASARTPAARSSRVAAAVAMKPAVTEPVAVIAKPKKGVSLAAATKAAGRSGQPIAGGRAITLDVPDGETAAGEAADLMATGKFEVVEPDYPLIPLEYTSAPNDPAFLDQESLQAASYEVDTASRSEFPHARSWHLWGPSSPNFTAVWPNLAVDGALYHARADGDDFPIAVIDTGYWLDQEDRGNIVGKKDFCQTYDDGVRTTDDDVTPVPPDATTYYDSVSRTYKQKVPDAATSHGTHVANLIAANTGNGIGTAGAAYDPLVHVYKIQGLIPDGSNAGKTYMPSSALIDAIRAAADDGARVISMSVGFASPSTSTVTLIQEAVDYAYARGCLLVAATGNNYQASLLYPAACDHVMSIGAYTLSADGLPARAVFSHYGTGTDLLAPGVFVYNALTPGKDFGAGADGYAFMTGTSMATPLVSSAAQILWRLAPSLSRDEVEGLLLQTAHDMGAAGYDVYTGYGRLDVEAAYDRLKSAYPALTAPAISSVGAGETRTSRDLSLSWSACAGSAVAYTVRGDWSETPLYEGSATHVDLTRLPDGGRTITVTPHSPLNWSDGTSVASVSFTQQSGYVPVYALTAASSSAAVGYGTAVTLSGAVTMDGEPLGSTAVGLERSTDGGATWSAFATATTSPSGSWSHPVAPSANTTYRASFGPLVRELAVKVYPYVGTPTMSTTRPYRNRTYTVHGTLKPRFTSGSNPVFVRFYKKSSSGRWYLKKTYSGKAYDYYSYSQYKTAYRFPEKGSWKIVATSKTTSAYASKSSSTRYVTVR